MGNLIAFSLSIGQIVQFNSNNRIMLVSLKKNDIWQIYEPNFAYMPIFVHRFFGQPYFNLILRF